MSIDALNPDQFAHTLGNLQVGAHFHLPGHEGTLTVSRNDTRAGKSRIMYRAEGDDQEFGYIAPALNHVDMD